MPPTESKNPYIRDTYRANTVHQLTVLYERLSAMSEDPQYTAETQRLARLEADYVLDLVMFRSLPKYKRRKLCEQKRTPWLGTWTRSHE